MIPRPTSLFLAILLVLLSWAGLPELPTCAHAQPLAPTGAEDGFPGMQGDPSGMPESGTSKPEPALPAEPSLSTKGINQSPPESLSSGKNPPAHFPTPTLPLKETTPPPLLPNRYDLPQPPELFGSRVFAELATQTLSKQLGPIGPDYVVGPGDSFQFYVWGREELSFTTEVNVQGDLTLPKFGRITVAGQTFEEMQRTVEAAIQQQIADFELSIVPVKQRQIRVYVLGEAVSPGVYDLNGFATAYTALFAAKGPSSAGSMRAITLKRGTTDVATIDLYDFLMYGNRSSDVPLQDGDVLFIPLAGPRITVQGAVKRQAVFELLPQASSLEEALKMAGGILPTGNPQKIQVARVVAHSRRTLFSSLLAGPTIGAKGAEQLQDMDEITIFNISPRNDDAIQLLGHVFQPGPRPWKTGMRIADLLDRPDLLKQNPFLEHGEIVREMGTGGKAAVIGFHLGKALAKDPEENRELQPKDQIRIFGAEEMNERAVVTIEGEVIKPGTYPLLSGMTIKDLIYRAGGLRSGASLFPAELTRRNIRNDKKSVERRQILISQVLRDDPKQNIPLQAFDTILVRSVQKWQRENRIRLAGEVLYPGVYTFETGERLSSVLQRAGGFTKHAYLRGAVFRRQSILEEQRTYFQRLITHLRLEREIRSLKGISRQESLSGEEKSQQVRSHEGQELAAEKLSGLEPSGRVIVRLSTDKSFEGSPSDLVLRAEDELLIPPEPNTVMVQGAVVNPNGVIFEPRKTMAYYIRKVGGFSQQADPQNLCLVRADGTAVGPGRRPDKCFRETLVEPGDIIWVPYDLRIPGTSKLKRYQAITQILGNLAITALAIQNATP